MRLWRNTLVPVLAAVAVVLLGAAGASGVDQMANARVTNPASVAIPAVTTDGEPPLRHLLMLSLAEGSLPGGYPYEEPREEKYDENFHETVHIGPATPA